MESMPTRDEMEKILRILRSANLLHNEQGAEEQVVGGNAAIFVDMCRISVVGKKKLEISIIPGKAFNYFCTNNECAGEMATDEYLMNVYPSCPQCGAPMMCDVELEDLMIMLMQISYELRNAGYDIVFSKQEPMEGDPDDWPSRRFH